MPNLVLYSRGLRPACAPCRARLPLSACVAQYQHCLAASTPSLARVPRVHEALPRILSASNACRSVRNGARSTRRRGRSPRAPLADSAGYRVLPARPAFAIPARRLHVSAAAHPVPFWLGRFAPSSRLHQWATPRPYELNWPLRAVTDLPPFVCESPSRSRLLQASRIDVASRVHANASLGLCTSRGRAQSVRME